MESKFVEELENEYPELKEVREFLENFKNSDGTYSLYDNHRNHQGNIFHEQLFMVDVSGPSWGYVDGSFSVGLGSCKIAGVTGGWEGEFVDLSLLDMFTAEVSADVISPEGFNFTAKASIWSPEAEVDILGVVLGIEGNIGAIGVEAKVSKNGIKIGAAGVGASLYVNWEGVLKNEE